MKVYIDNLEVDKNLIAVNISLNYGRFDYEGLVIDDYRVTLTIQEFIDAIEADYKGIRDEIKRDDEEQGEASEFTVISYGSIRELIKNKQALQDITTTYLDKILFGKLFRQSKNASFIINSTDLIEVKNDKIEITGRGCRKK